MSDTEANQSTAEKAVTTPPIAAPVDSSQSVPAPNPPPKKQKIYHKTSEEHAAFSDTDGDTGSTTGVSQLGNSDSAGHEHNGSNTDAYDSSDEDVYEDSSDEDGAADTSDADLAANASDTDIAPNTDGKVLADPLDRKGMAYKDGKRLTSQDWKKLSAEENAKRREKARKRLRRERKKAEEAHLTKDEKFNKKLDEAKGAKRRGMLIK